MFDGFEDAKDEQSRKRWFASAGMSFVIYGVVGLGILLLARQTVKKATAEPEIDVSFKSAEPEPEAAKPPPPAPPPKAAGPRPKRPGKVAPVQPKVIPEARPEEGDPTSGRHDEEVGEEYGDGLDLGGGGETKVAAPPPPPPPPPPPAKIERDPDPIDEVDTSVTRPVAMSGNAAPVYPEKARHKGVEAVVILKIRISAGGDVVDVEVLRGDEPFAAAAVAAVKTWRYRPATVDGKPVAVVKKLSIPFRIH